MKRTMAEPLLLAVGVALVVTLTFGCGRQQPAQPTGPGPGTTGPTPVATPDMTGKPLAEALAAVERPESFEATVTMADGKSMTMLVKGNWEVMRMTTDEGFVQIDEPASAMYMYDKAQNMAMKMDMTAASEDEEFRELGDPMEEVDQAAPILGEEEIDGAKCWTIQTTAKGEEAGEQAKMWILADSGLPRRMQSGENVTDFEYSRINELTDADFEMPEGCEVQELDLEELIP